MIKRFFSILAVMVLAVISTSCGSDKIPDAEIKNFDKPEIGEKIAVFHIKDYGDVKIKLFEDIAPNAVNNFVNLIESGYYDEHIIYYLKVDECLKSGDPKGNGTGGASFNGGYLNDEFSSSLRNFTGAVGFENEVDEDNNVIANSITSRFYIVNTEPANGLTDKFFDKIEEYGFRFPDNVKEKYKTVGGSPLFDGGYTVFGQVFSGMEVIYKINEAVVDGDLKPQQQIKISSAEIVSYAE